MANAWVRRNKWIFVVAPLAGAAFLWICGELIMYLWNWLLPGLFGWHVIDVWQALGLLLLCRMLFGGFGGGGNGKRRRRENWERMSLADREKFRTEMRARCGGFGAGDGKEPA